MTDFRTKVDEALADFEPDIILPGETLSRQTESIAKYDVEGRQLTGTADEIFDQWQTQQWLAKRHRTYLKLNGQWLRVGTDFRGIHTSLLLAMTAPHTPQVESVIPTVWETMVFDQDSRSLWQSGCCTSGAARKCHVDVVNLLLKAGAKQVASSMDMIIEDGVRDPDMP